ncbi:Permease of the drug/metabolite transporter (DMT) superfamily [Seinonella peptonophila]|uniref:Permease of the drug/metabolite transporter (DMT) superfamily n=1 Tax=Seinonella peptonophila TaxID=112248 RepID=A0A1M5BLT3_9BACL|nr:DMT family transporter [Seinonella peptonophila]SHF43458.1 Permease of the drug/metabolite transporter (DMT) superfamily [Seinonella peptonophila]
MEQQKKGFAYLAAISYSIFIGFSFMFLKLIVNQVPTMDILAYRFGIAFIILTIPLLFGWVKLNLHIRDFLRFLPLALFYPVLFFVFQALGMIGASSAEGGIIQATAPIFTIILSTLFLKEKTNLLQKISLLISVAGVITIFALQGSSFSLDHLQSILVLLLSTLTFAIYSILARPMNQTYRFFDITYAIIALSFIIFTAVAIIQHSVSGNFNTLFTPFTQPVFWYSIFYLGSFSTVFAVLLSNYAFSKLEAYKVSVFSNLATLVSIIAGIIFLHEPVTFAHLIGSIMIIAGVLGTNLAGHKPQKDTKDVPKLKKVTST